MQPSMMYHMPFTSRAVRVSALFAVCVGLAGCGGLDRNGQFREDPFNGLEQKLVNNVLVGAGIVSPQRDKITYTPRAPLALPPQHAAGKLRPPEDTSHAQVAAITPNWPLDPDEARRLRAEGVARASQTEAFSDEKFKRLNIEETEAARGKSTPGSLAPRTTEFDREGGGVVLNRDELERGWTKPTGEGLFSLFEIDETVDVREKQRAETTGQARDYLDKQAGSNNSFEGTLDRIDTSRLKGQAEPARKSVIDPPIGLRVPAPNIEPGPTANAILAAQDQGPTWVDYILKGVGLQK